MLRSRQRSLGCCEHADELSMAVLPRVFGWLDGEWIQTGAHHRSTNVRAEQLQTTILDLDTAIHRRREGRVVVSRMNNDAKHLAVVRALARHTFRRTGESIDAVTWPEGPIVGATGLQHGTDHAGGDQRAERKEPGRQRERGVAGVRSGGGDGEEAGLTGSIRDSPIVTVARQDPWRHHEHIFLPPP